MDHAFYTQSADQAVRAYSAFLAALTGLVRDASLRSWSPQVDAELRKQATSVADLYLSAQGPVIWAAIEKTALGALEDFQGQTSTSTALPPLLELMEALRDHLQSELSTQVARDIASASKMVRDQALHRRLGSQQGGLRFDFRDRAARSWNSATYIRYAWRQTLVIAASESFALAASENGYHEVEVVESGERLGISSSQFSANPFCNARDRVFHPNSSATLRVVDVPA